ncbi:MAG: Gfo/Idh/MocA family oxidoreductase [Bradyrhizobium sp.]|nr:Gfo/Idh/MocA family oxidoreductase [Bradyrhizobium sp.]
MRLAVAVVGMGIGQEHIAAYQALPALFDVVGICDTDSSRAQRAAARFNVAFVSTALEHLLERIEVDIVDICTPPSTHFFLAVQALRSGCHVICEKPLVSSLAELDRLEVAASKSARYVMPIFQYRFGNGLQRLKRIVDRGIAGKAYLSTIETAWRRGPDYYATPWRGRWQSELGGVCLTHAIHAHDVLTYLVGPAKEVCAETSTRVNDIEVEDCAAIAVRMLDGSLATLAATLGSIAEVSRYRFVFENLTAESSLAPYHPTRGPWTITGASSEVNANIESALAEFIPDLEGYAGQFAAFHGALLRGSEPPVTIGDARSSLSLITAIYASARTQQPVQLPISPSDPMYRRWLPG